MRVELACVPCFVRQAAEAVSAVIADEVRREAVLRTVVAAIASSDWSGSPPAVGQRIHRIIRRETGDADPYRALKDRMNRQAAAVLPTLREAVRAHGDPWEAAVRVAIVGNLLDSAAKRDSELADFEQVLETIWNRTLTGDLDGLKQAADRARSILYLTDNAGEVVLDSVLLEALPSGRVTIAVRGAPTINDATVEDAQWADVGRFGSVVSNGSDAPGTILEDCSADFRRLFQETDLVIAKGQGNYETLSSGKKNMFFLFIVKCPLVARRVGAPVGTLVVRRCDGDTDSAATPPPAWR